MSQDATFLYNPDCGVLPEDETLIAVLDGLEKFGEAGSKNGASILSSFFIDQRRKQTEEGQAGSGDFLLASALGQSMQQANTALIKISQTAMNSRKPSLQQEQRPAVELLTTCVAVAIKGNKAYIANVGDSRAYLLRGQTIIQLSKDDIDIFTGRLSLCLGLKEKLPLTINIVDLIPGDILALMSDGPYRNIVELDGTGKIRIPEVLGYLVSHAQSPKVQVENIIKGALKRGVDDDLSVVVYKHTGVSEQKK